MRVMRHHRDGPAARGISLRATVEMPTKGLHGRDVLLRHRGEALFPLQRCRNIRGQLFTFLRCADVIAALELRVQFFGEQLETLANVLMLVVAALLHKDHLVDPGALIALQVLADLRRIANATTASIVGEGVFNLQKMLPEIGAAWPVLAKNSDMAERVAKETEPI